MPSSFLDMRKRIGFCGGNMRESMYTSPMYISPERHTLEMCSVHSEYYQYTGRPVPISAADIHWTPNPLIGRMKDGWNVKPCGGWRLKPSSDGYGPNVGHLKEESQCPNNNAKVRRNAGGANLNLATTPYIPVPFSSTSAQRNRKPRKETGPVTFVWTREHIFSPRPTEIGIDTSLLQEQQICPVASSPLPTTVSTNSQTRLL
ncbi:hypothetical protein B0T13DRAFT_28684 [Neurospora crassa]|nr:hypothetical protein B0T13DRAFT_28684 [Neurospora crassa]